MAQNDDYQKAFHLGPMSAAIRYVLDVAPLPVSVTTRMNS